MIRWIDEGDIDGFNLTRILNPQSYRDFIELVVPELQQRGRFKTAYQPGSLRQKFFSSRIVCPRATRPRAGGLRLMFVNLTSGNQDEICLISGAERRNITASAFAAGDYSGALKVGTTAAFAPPLETAVAEAKKQGLQVELVEFTDWTAPNVSVENGDIDVNLFQHKPFLDNANREGGFHLVPYAPAIINNIGLYSKKHTAIDQIPDGGTVAIANDPINGARGLLLLQKRS